MDCALRGFGAGSRWSSRSVGGLDRVTKPLPFDETALQRQDLTRSRFDQFPRQPGAGSFLGSITVQNETALRPGLLGDVASFDPLCAGDLLALLSNYGRGRCLSYVGTEGQIIKKLHLNGNYPPSRCRSETGPSADRATRGRPGRSRASRLPSAPAR